MKKFKLFALKRPFLFGLVLIFIFSVLGTLTYPVHFLFPENTVGLLYGDAVAQLIIFFVFVWILWRFGWLQASGLTRLGRSWIWLLVLGVLVYKVPAEVYAFTGDVSIKLPNSQLAAANLVYLLPASLVEETMYRGLVLIAMILAWGDTKRGQIKAVLLSSL